MNHSGSLNRVYSLVWSVRLGAWVVASELTKRNGKTGSVVRSGRWGVAALLLGGAIQALAQSPSGGTVVGGSANIVQNTPQLTTITQATQKAIIDWQSFSIGAGNTVQFIQPNASAIALNRVTGNQMSQINGSLLANGQVWLLNPNGVLIGAGGQVNVGSFLGTTHNLSNQQFMQGDYRFSGDGVLPGAMVSNLGSITANNGGYAILAGNAVRNEGTIQANLGQVVLGGAKHFTVDVVGDKLLSFAVTGEVDAQPLDGKALVENAGTLQADGGRVTMTAKALRNVLDQVINTRGLVQATTAQLINGEIVLSGGDAGQVTVSGKVDASSTTGKAGKIDISGETVVLEAAEIDAIGLTQGGLVRIGGAFQGGKTPDTSQAYNQTYVQRWGATSVISNARQTTIDANSNIDVSSSQGSGGTAVIWSDQQTLQYGSIDARGLLSGGSVEISSANRFQANLGNVKVGSGGYLLLDPKNITITSTTTNSGWTFADDPGTDSSISTSEIVTNLNAGTSVVLQANNDITLASGINVTPTGTAGNLTLQAGRNINFNANVTTGGGNLTAIAGDANALAAYKEAGTPTINIANGVTLNVGSGTATFNTNVISGTGTISGSGANVIINNTQSSTFAGKVTGTGTKLSKTGAGYLYLSGTNDYTGGTEIYNSSVLVVGSGGTGSIIGNVAITDSASILSFDSINLTLTGNITGSGGISLGNYANITLTGDNAFSGNTSVFDGTLVLGSNTALQNTTNIWLHGGILKYGASNIPDYSSRMSWTRDLKIDTNGYDIVFASPISFGTDAGFARSIIKYGAGTLTLASTLNNLAGSTTINAGTLQIGNGGTTGDINNTSSVINSGTLVFNRSDTSTFTKVISGSGNLVKSGAGDLTLSGNNSYSGGTNLMAGTLTMGSANAIGTSGTISFGGGTLKYGATITSDLSARFSQADNQQYNIDIGTYTQEFNTALTSVGGSLSLQGSTLYLKADNTYTGNTTINSNSSLVLGNTTTTSTAGSVAGNIVNNGILTFYRTDNITYAGVISGTGRIVKDSNNTTSVLTLSGNNSFAGTTTVVAGTIKLGNTSALGSGSAMVYVWNGATLDLNGTTLATAKPLTINGTGNGGIGALTNSSATAATYAGLLSLTGDTTILSNNGSIILSHTGSISSNNFGLTLGGTATGNLLAGSLNAGYAGFNKTDSGSWTITGNTVFGGYLNVTGTLTFGDGSANGGLGASNIYNNSIYIAGDSQLVINNSLNQTLGASTYGINGGGSIVKSGSGNLTILGANTYGGSTTINAGTLKVGDATALSGSAVTNNSVLDLNGINLSVGSLAGSGTVTNTSATAATLSTGSNNTDTSFTGVIQNGTGTTALTKTGSGTLSLSGNNTYTGNTTLTAGALALDSANALGTTGSIDLIGGRLQHSSNNTTDYSSRFVSGTGKTFDIVVPSGVTVSYDADLSGASILKRGQGSLILRGSNTFTESVIIAGGTTELGSANALGPANSTVTIHMSGGYLRHTAHNTLDYSSRFGGLGWLYVDTNGQTITWATNCSLPYSYISIYGTGELILSGSFPSLDGVYLEQGTLVLNNANIATKLPTAEWLGIDFQGGILRHTANNTTDFSPYFVPNPSSTTAAPYKIDIPNGVNVSYGAIAATKQGLTKLGSGTLTLTGDNTYTGSTTINAGTLQIGSGGTTGSLGSDGTTHSDVTIAQGATLSFLRGASTTMYSLAPHNISGGGKLEFKSYLGVADEGKYYVGNINATGLSHTSIIEVGDGAALSVDLSSNVGSASINVISGGSLLLNNVTLNNPISIAGLGYTTNMPAPEGTVQMGALAFNRSTLNGPITLTGNARIGVNDFNGVGVGAGYSQINGTISGSYALEKTGAAELILSGTNTYTGVTTVTEGTLTIGNGAYGAGTSGRIVGNIVNNADLIFDRNNNYAFAGAISGSGTVSQMGDGKLTLSGNNTYTGGTELYFGVLELGSSTAIGSTGTITMAGGTLQHTINNVMDYSSRFAGTADQQYLINTNGLNIIYAGNLNSSNGSLTKFGNGTLTLTGTNTYTGPTNIAAGTLNLQNDNPNLNMQFNGAGSLVIQPTTTSFSQPINTANTLFANTLSALSIGKEFNNSAITLGSNININGPVTIDGGNFTLALNKSIATTNGDIKLRSSGTMNLATGTSIQASNGDIRLAAARFVNNAGATALVAGTGKNWQVWSSNVDPFTTNGTGDVRGNLAANYKQYGAVINGTVLGSGNGFLYTNFAPQVVVSLTGTVAKPYDGTPTATINPNNYQASGMVDGDNIVFNTGSAFYTSAGTGVGIKDAGSALQVQLNDISIASASKGPVAVYGYSLSSTSAVGNVGVINRKVVNLAATKTYNGNNILNGFVTITTGVQGETLSYSGATANTSQVGPQGKFINAITLANATDGSGGLASNYDTPNLGVAGPKNNVTIEREVLFYTANLAKRSVGQPNPELIGSVTGFVAGETEASATQGTKLFTSGANGQSPAGKYAIFGQGLTAANYRFEQAVGNATALSVEGSTAPIFIPPPSVFQPPPPPLVQPPPPPPTGSNTPPPPPPPTSGNTPPPPPPPATGGDRPPPPPTPGDRPALSGDQPPPPKGDGAAPDAKPEGPRDRPPANANEGAEPPPKDGRPKDGPPKDEPKREGNAESGANSDAPAKSVDKEDGKPAPDKPAPADKRPLAEPQTPGDRPAATDRPAPTSTPDRPAVAAAKDTPTNKPAGATSRSNDATPAPVMALAPSPVPTTKPPTPKDVGDSGDKTLAAVTPPEPPKPPPSPKRSTVSVAPVAGSTMVQQQIVEPPRAQQNPGVETRFSGTPNSGNW